MRRRYDLARFFAAVGAARAVRPDLALTGDMMVGFPGETAADFERTLEAVDRAGFTGLHVFRYSPRPRTAAARYADAVPVAQSRRRSAELIALGQRLKAAYERGYAGRPLQVIWDRTAGGRIRGISENYIQVSAEPAGRAAGQEETVVYEQSA